MEIILLDFVKLHFAIGGIDVAIMWFWIFVGIAYAVLATVDWHFASHMETISLQPIKRYPVFSDSEEEIKKLFDGTLKNLQEQQKRFEDGLITQAELNKAYNEWHSMAKALGDEAAHLNLNEVFTKIEVVAARFDKATKANQKILYLASISFIIAAGISFAQGLALI
jgi:hypothetical protein